MEFGLWDWGLQQQYNMLCSHDLILKMLLMLELTNKLCSTCWSLPVSGRRSVPTPCLCADDLLHLISSAVLVGVLGRMILKDPPIWKGWRAAARTKLPSRFPRGNWFHRGTGTGMQSSKKLPFPSWNEWECSCSDFLNHAHAFNIKTYSIINSPGPDLS